MRGFRIWPHNSNRVTFDLFFVQKTVGNRGIFKNLLNPYFRQFLGQKRGQILLALHFAARFGVLSSFLGPHLIQFSYFDFLTFPCIFLNFQIARAARFLQIEHFRQHFRYQDCLVQRNITGQL